MTHLLFLCCSSQISGAERSLIAMLRNIPRTEYRVTLVVPGNGPVREILKDTCDMVDLPLIRFRRTLSPIVMLSYLWNVVRVTLAIRKIILEKNVSLLAANSFSANIYSWLVKRLTNVKVIGFVRDNVTFKRFSSIVFAANDRSVPVSQYIGQQVLCPGVKKVIAYPALDFTSSSDRRNFRGAHRIDEDDFVIGCIAQFTTWKRHCDFIKAAEIIAHKAPGVHFLMAGNCLSKDDVAYRDTLLAEIDKRGLGKMFTVLPFQENVTSLLSALDLLIHCALEEPFGRVVMESMYFGKPVIAYASGGVQEIVVDGQTGYLVSPGNYEGVAERAIALRYDPVLAAEYGRCGKLVVKKKFSHDSQTVNRLLQSVLYEENV